MRKSAAIIGTRGYPSYYGGFETLIRRLAPYLATSGWNVTVYGRPGAVKSDDPNTQTAVNSVITRGLETKSLSTLSYGFTAVLHTVRTKPDVALIMNVANGFWLPLLKLRRIPTVVNVDGIEWERAKWGSVAKAVFHLGARFTARFADRIVCDSIEIQRRWREEFRRDSVFIPYGADPRKSQPATDELQTGKYVVYVARFVPENTIDEFLEAISQYNTSWDIVIVGSSGYGGPIEDKISKICAANRNIRWLGHISDDQRLFSLWQNAGAYFHGHSVGGTNPALVQAMALGVPTVARDTVYNREVLGDAAVFVDPTPQSIYEGLERVMRDPSTQEKLRRGVQTRARERYTWSAVCDAYKQQLQDASIINKSYRAGETQYS